VSFLRVLEVLELLDAPDVAGAGARRYLQDHDTGRLSQIEVINVKAPTGCTDFIRILLPGLEGKSSGGPAPTLGIIGRLGGVGARPGRLGLVSDADGAIVALATAATLLRAASRGDRLPGDVVVATHICPNAPTTPHEPVDFMGSPVDMQTMNRHEVSGELDAVLSVDATKGNRIVNHRGFAITPTVKEGYILRTSEDLLDIMSYVTGRSPVVLPITMQDITPYGNDIYHVNSIMQPATATTAPVVGVALTAQITVPGCATGANYPTDLAETVRFCIEVAKGFTGNEVTFLDMAQFERMVQLYGSMRHLVSAPSE